MTTKEKGVIVRYRLKKIRAGALPGKENDMSTMILSLNKIEERYCEAMPRYFEQGFDYACLYINKISRSAKEDILV